MFRFFQPSRAPFSRMVWGRVFLFGAALLLLWLALQVRPRREAAGPDALYSDASGTVAVNTDKPARRAERSVFSFSTGNMAALLLLLGGVGGAVYLRRRAGGGSATASIESLGHLQIAPNQQLRLVRCGGEVLLLGVASGQITLLKSFADDAFAREAPAAEASAPGVSFEALLRRQAGPFPHTQAPTSPC